MTSIITHDKQGHLNEAIFNVIFIRSPGINSFRPLKKIFFTIKNI